MREGEKYGKRFLYLTDVDISVDNGPGINEREFVRILLDRYGDLVTCMTPEPLYPENYYDRRISYIKRHSKWKSIGYGQYLADSFSKLLDSSSTNLEGLIARPTILGIEPILFHYISKRPVFLQKMGGYAVFGKENKDWLRQITGKLLFCIHGHMARTAEACDVPSETYREWVAWKYQIPTGKLFVVRNGANIEQFRPVNPTRARKELGLNAPRPLVGYTGALRELRNIELLIESIRILNAKRPVYCMVVGDGPQRLQLERLVCVSGLEDKVIFTGSVGYRDVYKYIGLFDVAVDLTLVPLKIENKVRYASFSQKIAQYLACGKPVVAWNIPDNEFIEKNLLGALAEPLKMESLCHAIGSVIEDQHGDFNQACKRARGYACENLSLAKVTEDRFQVWESIVAKKSVDRGNVGSIRKGVYVD